MGLSSLFAGAAAALMLVAAAEPVRIPPSDKWILEYAADSCRLFRTFGDGKTKTILLLDSAAPERMEMLAIGRPLATFAEEVGARFMPVGGKPFKGRTAESSTSGQPAVLWSNIHLLPDAAIESLEKQQAEAKPDVRPPPIDLAERARTRSERQQFAKNATALEIQTRGNKKVILETGPMGEPIRMLDECSRESLKDWGVDPDLEDRIVRPVWAAHPEQWFSTDDYPRNMIIRGQESEVSVRLLVDASGKVTKCTSLSQFQEAEFNKITCDNYMKRAHFAPAELADGTKVPSYYTQRVLFKIGR